jgi:ABC-type branched-subunit amino acid transport system substrate-binding protein
VKFKVIPTLSMTLLLLLILFSLSIVQAQGQSVFRIGVLDNERGPLADGARLAVQEINNAGGVTGADGTLFRLELIIQPTNAGANLNNAVANLQQASVIAAIGPVSNEEVLNGLPALQTLNVPILTTATTETLIASDTSGRIFRIRASQLLQSRALADYLINELNLTSIATAQLDIDSTEKVIGFSTSASNLGVAPQPALLYEGDINAMTQQVIQADPQALVAYGDAAIGSTLYSGLRAAGWTGLFTYDEVNDTNFRATIPLEQLNGILSITTWPYTAADEESISFLNSYIRTFGEIPGPIEAASYDAVNLLAAAIGRPGTLINNLSQLDNIQGVQGVLRPAQLPRGELSDNVSVTALGVFGAPEVVARYAGTQRLPDEQPDTGANAGTPIPAPTATPEGVTLTVLSERQNVRSGPGTAYDIIGQLSEGEQVRVIGANIENTWVVIDFRGRQGWLSVSIADVFGDLNTVPIVNPPPTPTPGFTPTPVPPQEADIVIVSAASNPSPIVSGQQFTLNVAVRNNGNTRAGQFAVAATFPPDNAYAAGFIDSLDPGQTKTINLTATLNGSGNYSVVIVADLNNQIPEGAVGETNNNFTFSYAINDNGSSTINSGSETLDAGEVLDLEDDGVLGDISWDGNALYGLSGTTLGIINVNFSNINRGAIDPDDINENTISRTAMNAGTVIGVITADGNRGALRVDDIPGNQIRLTYVVYED